jgi:hypothetical protein
MQNNKPKKLIRAKTPEAQKFWKAIDETKVEVKTWPKWKQYL